MNIAVIGQGGREHALCAALRGAALQASGGGGAQGTRDGDSRGTQDGDSRDSQGTRNSQLDTLYAIPGNPGMAEIATCVPINPMNLEELAQFCIKQDIRLVIPGSEVYLEHGIADHLSKLGIDVFGPSQAAAQVETSKQFAKDIMARYNIPTAGYKVFTDYENAWSHVRKNGVPTVLKYDGLAGGKGVVVAETLEEAQTALDKMLKQRAYGDGAVVIEEYLEGPECSLMCFVHGDIVIPMPLAQDHKRLLDQDKGPNTGGMGIYSPVPIIAPHIAEQAMTSIMKPMARALQSEGIPYTGFLYGGLMVTGDGPKVIEFNARFGDPEAEVILPKLQSNLLSIIRSMLAGEAPDVSWSEDYVVGVVMAAKGYPSAYETGHPIRHLNRVEDVVYHMGTTTIDGQICTNGGRVLLVTGRADTLQRAVANAYQNVEILSCGNLVYRTDIAHQSL